MPRRGVTLADRVEDVLEIANAALELIGPSTPALSRDRADLGGYAKASPRRPANASTNARTRQPCTHSTNGPASPQN